MAATSKTKTTLWVLAAAAGATIATVLGCSILEPAFEHTLGQVRSLPPDAPTPGWQDLTGEFIAAVLTILGGTIGGAGLYSGIIRPRRITREETIRMRELVKSRLERGGVNDELDKPPKPS